MGDVSDVEQLAERLRIHALRMISQARSSHLGGNFSMAEIMAVLYGRVLRLSPETVDDPDRDRLVLSKGHAAAIYYAALAESGFFPVEWLDSYYTDGAKLAGHATRGMPGIEVSTGALGHGLPIAVGMAMAAKRSGASWRVFAVMSDGECDEGTTWEAALLAAQHQLDNLTAIVDYNKIQALGHTADVVDLEPFAEKWAAFRWGVEEIDGHDCAALASILDRVPAVAGRPTCVIAHTIKGKGVSFMEDSLLWHYRNPQGEEYESALRELERDR